MSYPPQYGQGGYPPGWGTPPPKSKTGLWVGLSTAAAVVIAFVITAFVAPGFLLADDERTPAGGGNGARTGGAQAVAERIIAALKAGDVKALNAARCEDADSSVDQAIGMAQQISDARLTGKVTESGGTARAPSSVKVGGREYPSVAELAKEGDTWCWRSVAIEGMEGQPSADPSASASEEVDPNDPRIAKGPTAKADEAIEAFVGAINSGDRKAAKGMLCAPDTRLWNQRVDEAIDIGAQLAVEPSEQSGESFVADMTAKTKDDERRGTVSVRGAQENYCVASLSDLTSNF